MTRIHHLSAMALIATLLLATYPVASAVEPPRKAALFVANHAEKIFDEKLATFEDLITRPFTEKGFNVLSREVSTDALSGLLKDSKQTDVDRLLSDNSTVLRLGQLLGADFLIVASITSFGSDKNSTEVYGVKTVNITHTLNVTYKLLDGTFGGTLAADTVEVTKTIRYMENSRPDPGNLINGLLKDATKEVASSLEKKEIRLAVTSQGMIDLRVSCGMQDLAQIPMGIPDVRLTKDNTVVIGKDKLNVEALDVTVELDGVVAGSAPGSFKAAPGLHKIRLSREGFTPWGRTMNVTEGQSPLKVALQMSDAGYQRWKDNIAFLASVENGKKLTDAEVKVLEGKAQMLRQSGYKVDVKEDIKVDTKEGVKVYQSQSLFSQLPGR